MEWDTGETVCNSTFKKCYSKTAYCTWLVTLMHIHIYDKIQCRHISRLTSTTTPQALIRPAAAWDRRIASCQVLISYQRSVSITQDHIRSHYYCRSQSNLGLSLSYLSSTLNPRMALTWLSPPGLITGLNPETSLYTYF